MPTRNIDLTDRYDRFIEEQVTSGRYENPGEVMRAGLRLLEQHTREEQEKLDALRALAAEGFEELEQGRGLVFDDTDELSEFVGEIGRRAANRASRAEER